jgi:Protein of unknown function (DUF551)
MTDAQLEKLILAHSEEHTGNIRDPYEFALAVVQASRTTPTDQAVPEDFALVPIRMNANMINAWSGGKTVSSDEVAYRTTFQDAWKRVLEAAPQAPQKDAWISVDERLPEIIEWSPGSVAGISEPVYVYFGEDEDQAVWRYRRGGRGDLTSCYWDLDEITPTHWRPVYASPNVTSSTDGYLES